MGTTRPLLRGFFPGLVLKEVEKTTDAGGHCDADAEEQKTTRRFLRPIDAKPATLDLNAIKPL